MHDTSGNVTVKEALKKGKWQLLYIPLLLMFLLMGLYGLGLYILSETSVADWIGIVYGFGGMLLALCLPLVYYYKMLPRWRIWAYTNVRNVHELRRKAILARILYEHDSFYMRFEIKSAEQKEQLRQLEQKFEQRDEFIDDLAVPFETAFTSEKNLKTNTIVLIVFLAVGMLMFAIDEYSAGIIMLAVVAFMGLLHIRARNRLKDATLTFSNEGITTKNADFHSWGQVQNEKVHPVGSGESTRFWLSYEVAGEKVQVSLQEFSAPPKKVDHIVRIYRGRYEAANKRNSGTRAVF